MTTEAFDGVSTFALACGGVTEENLVYDNMQTSNDDRRSCHLIHHALQPEMIVHASHPVAVAIPLAHLQRRFHTLVIRHTQCFHGFIAFESHGCKHREGVCVQRHVEWVAVVEIVLDAWGRCEIQ